jgi:hypothetical protein
VRRRTAIVLRSVSTFLQAGLVEVNRPTLRRAVMRIDFPGPGDAHLDV